MIPENKKTQEELAALREEHGIPDVFPKPIPPPETQNSQPAAQETDPSAPAPTKKPETVQYHSLRKSELPLAPAPPRTHKTVLPIVRHAPRDIVEIRRRDALANLTDNPQSQLVHLKKMTAHPIILIIAYLLALGAAFAIWQRALYLTPLVLIVLSILFTVYIFLTKKRSRHHGAILTIIIVMTLAFGGLYYAPLFTYAT